VVGYVVSADHHRREGGYDHPEGDPHHAADVRDLVRAARPPLRTLMSAAKPTNTPAISASERNSSVSCISRHLPSALSSAARNGR
jgi:hypothetical protein